MKRLLLFALSLLTMASATWAQPEPDPLPTEPVLIPENHWTYTGGQYQHETFVYSDLIVVTPDANQTINAFSDLNAYEFAAFVQGEVGDPQLRGIGELVQNTNSPVEAYLIRFRIEGTLPQDNGSVISFKAFDKTTQIEYELSVEQEIPVFTGETIDPGIPSNPLHLDLCPLTSLSLNNIDLNVGEEVDLKNYLNPYPSTASLPSNISFQLPDGINCVTLNGSVMEAVAPNAEGFTLTATAGNISTYNTIRIFQPATAIEQYLTEITVNVGDNERLNNQLGAAFALTPSNSTDRIVWSSANEEIVGINAKVLLAEAYAVGDAVLTGTIVDHTGTAREAIAPINVTVHVAQPVTGITSQFIFHPESSDITYIECLPGDDLTPYFVDGLAFNIEPANATNKAVKIEYAIPESETRAVSIGTDGKITALAGNAITEVLKVTSLSDPTKSVNVYVRVYSAYTDIVAPTPSYNISVTEFPKNITTLFNMDEAFVMLPTTAAYMHDLYFSIVSSDPTVVNYLMPDDPTTATEENAGFFAYKAGTATITATIKVKDYLAATFDPTGDDHVTMKSASFDFIISEGLSGLALEFPTNFVAGDDATFTIKPVPSGASFDTDLSKFVVTAIYSGNETWDPLGIKDGCDLAFDNQGNVVCDVHPRIPGSVLVQVRYDDGTADGLAITSDPVQIGYTYNFGSGWQWQSIPFGDPAGEKLDLSTIYGDDLIEIRTQSEQLYNDPQYGYFGDNHLISQNTCFKLKMNENPEANEYIFTSGQLGQIPDITLRAGWNWIPNPFFFDRWLNLAFTEMAFENGDRIVSFADGFVEFEDGDWIGTLEEFKCGQGYMFYNAGSEGRTLPFVNELTLPDDHDRYTYTAPARRLPDYALFTYDPSRFRDNMTIVAQLENVPFVDNCRVFAFVGDECRGQGAAVQGKLFITVHGQAGETITFKLYDDDTRDLCEINESVPFQSMLGTVRQPLKMQKGKTIVTGVQGLSTDAAATESFDLSGRRISGSQRGISIQRLSDGSVRKVVRK